MKTAPVGDGDTYVLTRSCGRRLRSRGLAPGLTSRAVLDKFKTVQMIDVHFPTTDGKTLLLPRYTQPDKDLRILLHRLDMRLPEQPPPRIEAPSVE